MLTRTALALLLLSPTVGAAQDLDTAVSALVRISGTRSGTAVRGTGFVVGLDRDKATIVTASHVIEGGFPEMSTEPLALRRIFSGPDGNFLKLDLPAGEGFSGGPVLRGDKVVGVVMEEDLQLTFAVRALVAQAAVIGWGANSVDREAHRHPS